MKKNCLKLERKEFPYIFLLKGRVCKRCSQDALILKRFKSFQEIFFDDFPQNEIVKEIL